MHRKALLLALITFSILINACNGRKNMAGDVKPGAIAQKMRATADTTIQYALFIPSEYNGKSEWPLLLCFDPHADGLFPVNLFDSLAEKYNFIVAGSFNSKNGMSLADNYRIYDVMMNDLKERFNINPGAVYGAGFSGGARVATAIAIEKGGLAGVIACGAGLPQTTSGPKSPFSYLGLAGNRDFNYLEMEEQQHMLEQSGFVSDFIVFEGIHEWPPYPMNEQIFKWLQLDMMRNKSIQLNREAIDRFIDERTHQADSLQKEGRIFETFQEYLHLRRYLSGLTNTDPLDEEISKMKIAKDVVAKQQEMDALRSREKLLREQYSPLIAERGPQFWQAESSRLFGLSKMAKNLDEQKMYSRILAFLSMNSYMLANNALRDSKLKEAADFIENYRLVDPTNSEHRYFAAVLSIRQKDTANAINMLNEAVKLGFVDYKRILDDPDFLPLHDLPRFKAIFPK